MKYTFAEFDRLKLTIEELGGKLLRDRTCTGRNYKFDQAVQPVKDLMLAGCANVSLFEIPYWAKLPDEDQKAAGVKAVIVQCAVCDDLGRKPRFQSPLETV